jgi:rhodanese-related sulfurtransferase
MYKRAARESGLILCAAVLLGFSYTFVTGRGFFGTKESPSAVTSVKVGPGPSPISLAEARKLFETKGAVFVDARHPFDFRRGHIPSAINIPLSELDANRKAVEALPRDSVIIVYCDGSECNSSIELAAKLYEDGLGGVRIFFGGWQEWTANNLPTESSP